MLTRWAFNDLDTTFAVMDEFRRRLDRVFDDLQPGRQAPQAEGWTTGWPRTALIDTGASFLLRSEVPGLSEKDITISVHQDVLTLSGERRTQAPEGYTVHRRERPDLRFSRSFNLPGKVDLEKCTATVKQGVLTIALPKAPESQPRQISVKAL